MPQEKYKYQDASLPIEIRLKDLLGRMTLEEKLRQMNMCAIQGRLFKEGVYFPEKAEEFIGDVAIGAVQDMRKDPETCARNVNIIQDYMLNQTRLSIPAFVVAECLHGVMSFKTTVFPQAIGLASTWNTSLIKEVAEKAAKEARSIGITQVLAPNLDLAREPRWGRVEETYGEDPYLCSSMGVAYIKGLQGETGYIDREHVVATVKHFAAHGTPEGGVNISPVFVGDRQLRELYLPPFKAGLQEAGALSVMPGYSEFDGIPLTSSKYLLHTILREEWGFEGYLISDFGSIDMLHELHKTASSLEEAGRQSLEAGMDMEAPDLRTFTDLHRLVTEGIISEEIIDQAVCRILKVKFLAGLFEHCHAGTQENVAKIVNCQEHKDLALKTAHESIVLLKNEQNLLPLKKNLKSIAVIGPNASRAQLGNYSYYKEEAVTPLKGLQNKLADNTIINFAEGCGLFELSKDGIHEAVEAAKNSEIAILFVGETSAVKGGIGWGTKAKTIATCGEGFDRHTLDLPGVQQELVEAVVQTGTPTIVVLINGRPLSIPWIAEHVPAILEAWYPGEEGGNAIADILFGDVNPSGKLNVSFPKDVGQVPVYYNYKPSARGFYEDFGSPGNPGRNYVFLDTLPLYEFGFGLSYTRFEYSELKLSSGRIKPFEKVTVSVNVKNTGQCEGKEVVQLYINDVFSTYTTPVKVLRGFEKILLQPGEVKNVTFELNHTDLELLDSQSKPVVEVGDFEIMVGELKEILIVY